MKRLKRIIKIFFFSVILLLLFVMGGSWIYHSFAMKKEIASTPPPGMMVDVNGHAMHVYSEGDGEKQSYFFQVQAQVRPSLISSRFGRHYLRNIPLQSWRKPDTVGVKLPMYQERLTPFSRKVEVHFILQIYPLLTYWQRIRCPRSRQSGGHKNTRMKLPQ